MGFHDSMPELAALATVILWAWVLTPLILRPFGVSIPITMNPWKKKWQKWGLRQNLLFGALGFGISMTIFGTTEKYVRWKLNGSLSDQPTIVGFAKIAIEWICTGIVFGLIMSFWDSRQVKDQPNQSL